MIKTRVEPWLPAIVLVWFAGVALFAFRPLASWYTVRRLRKVGVSPVNAAIRDLLDRTAKKLRLARAVAVLQSTLVKTPVVVGFFRPLILLPLCVVTGLPESQLELILAHELAHIRRNDYLVNLLQALVETLFFYHPAVWWLSRQIRHERENCCDDVAVSLCGNRADYGRALLAIEELRAASPELAVAASGGRLLARIRRIAGRETAPPLVGISSLSAILVLVALVGTGLWVGAPRAGASDDASVVPGRGEGRTAVAEKQEPPKPFVAWSVVDDFKANEPHDPLVVNGMVVVGTDHGDLNVYRCKDGQIIWNHEHGRRIFHRPCSDGERIYFTSDVGLTAVTAKDGLTAWSFGYCDGPSCVLAKKKTAYFAGEDGNLYAVDAETGKQRWQCDFFADCAAGPARFSRRKARTTGAKARPSALASDGETLFLSVMDQSRVIAVNATTGKKRWSFQARGWIDGAAVATEKLVFFGSQDDFFYCLDKETGKEIWKHKTKGRIESGGLVDGSFVYFASCDGSLYCLNQSDGKQHWRFDADRKADGSKTHMYSVPVLYQGAVCFAAGEGQAYAVDRRKGTLVWKLRPSPGSEIVCSPATDGSLIFLATRRTFQKRGQPSLVAVGVPPPAKQTGKTGESPAAKTSGTSLGAAKDSGNPTAFTSTPDHTKYWPLSLKEALRLAIHNSKTMRQVGATVQVVESKSNTTPSAGQKAAQAPDDSRLVVARGNTDVSLTAFEASLCSLVSDVDAAYWDLFLQHRLTEIAVEGRNRALQTWQKENAAANEKKPQGGGGSPRAILGLQSRRPTGAVQVYHAETRLRFLMGIPATDGRLIRPADKPSTAKLSVDWQQATSEALRRSPAIREARVRVKQCANWN